jgi:hypothetical protein
MPFKITNTSAAPRLYGNSPKSPLFPIEPTLDVVRANTEIEINYQSRDHALYLPSQKGNGLLEERSGHLHAQPFLWTSFDFQNSTLMSQQKPTDQSGRLARPGWFEQ